MALRFRLYAAGAAIHRSYYNFRIARAGRFVASRNRHGQYDESLKLQHRGNRRHKSAVSPSSIAILQAIRRQFINN